MDIPKRPFCVAASRDDCRRLKESSENLGTDWVSVGNLVDLSAVFENLDCQSYEAHRRGNYFYLWKF